MSIAACGGTALAYVFWHAPQPAANRARYERALVDFHAALAAAPPAGFLRSFTARTGAGGLYRLVRGDAAAPAHATWFGKAAGVSYGAFERVLHDAVPRDATLWQRQMVLGPAPEYVAHSQAALPVRDMLQTSHTAVMEPLAISAAR